MKNKKNLAMTILSTVTISSVFVSCSKNNSSGSKDNNLNLSFSSELENYEGLTGEKEGYIENNIKIKNNIKYELDSKHQTAKVLGFVDKDKSTTLKILGEVEDKNGENYEVTEIGDQAFDGCSGLTSLKIPDSIKDIGAFAFDGCSGLTGKLEIPDNVRWIGGKAFHGCNQLTLSLLKGKQAYRANSYEPVDEIDLKKIDAVQIVDAKNIKEKGGIKYEIDGDRARVFRCNRNKTGEFSISKSIDFKGAVYEVNEIGRFAFVSCWDLTRVVIPEGIKNIGDYAFSGRRMLTEIVIPEGVEKIGDSAFDFCSGLESGIVIPGSVNEIGRDAFRNCNVEITLPEGKKLYEDEAGTREYDGELKNGPKKTVYIK